jgi:hypothetical protein
MIRARRDFATFVALIAPSSLGKPAIWKTIAATG